MGNQKVVAVSSDQRKSATFIFQDGREIQVYISSIDPSGITVSGDDTMVIEPSAANQIRVSFREDRKGKKKGN